MSIATQENCPECGSQLVLAEGGGYWDCSHPQCQGHLTFKTEKIIRKLREERADFRDKRLIMLPTVAWKRPCPGPSTQRTRPLHAHRVLGSRVTP
jgi:ribosomal protein S27AE